MSWSAWQRFYALFSKACAKAEIMQLRLVSIQNSFKWHFFSSEVPFSSPAACSVPYCSVYVKTEYAHTDQLLKEENWLWKVPPVSNYFPDYVL